MTAETTATETEITNDEQKPLLPARMIATGLSRVVVDGILHAARPEEINELESTTEFYKCVQKVRMAIAKRRRGEQIKGQAKE